MKSSTDKETGKTSSENETLDEIESESRQIQYEIPPLASLADKKLYSNIKKTVLEYITRDSHGYKPEKGEFRASSIGYCSRKILLNKNTDTLLTEQEIKLLPDWKQRDLDVPEDYEIETGAHISGQAIHEIVQTALEKDVVGIEEEVSLVGPNFKLIGHYDLLMKDEEGNKIVIDIKSTSAPRDFLPNKSHLKQLMAYQGMLDGIKGGLLYIKRNNWEMTFIPQDFNKTEFSNIITKLSHLALMEDKMKLPKIDPDIFETECKTPYWQCPYFEYCFPDYVEPKVNDGDETQI